MSAVIPLSVWPYPVPPEVMDALRVAKDALMARDNLDFKLQVSPAVAGGEFRVLSFKGPTPFIADISLLRNWEDPKELMYWLEWVLDPGMPVELGFTKEQWMALNLPGAKQIHVEAVQPAVSFVTDELYDKLPY